MTIKDELCPRIKADAKLMGDGTLWIKTDKLDNVGRVLVEHGTRCKQFYQDAQPEQPSFSYGHEDDLISRQAVIDAILAVTNFNNVREMLDYVLENNLTNDCIGGVIDSIDAVIEVDSAQPEIIYCKDCVRNIGPEFGFCDRANHHVSLNSCCANVFHAERRDAE